MRLVYLLGVVTIVLRRCNAEVGTMASVPRGVAYKLSPLYRNADGHFTCLDGSRTILHTQINDDYCDCPDGSDEPGTSACPNGHFFCLNKGHEGEFIPSSRVNDKICDCCDGSDEWDESVQCANVCEELGKSARLERERQKDKQRKGFAARQELAKTGQALKKDFADKLVPLKAERDALQPKKDELEAKKKEAEEKETRLQNLHKDAWEAEKKEKRRVAAEKMFKKLDKNEDGQLDLTEIKEIKYLDTNLDGTVSDEEAKRYLSIDSANFDHFLNDMYNSLKLAKRDRDRESYPDDHHGLEDEQNEEGEEDELPEDRPVTDEPPSNTENEATPHPEEKPDDEFDDADDALPPAYDDETNKATADADAVRKEYDELNNQISNIDRQIRESEQFIEQDYGEDFAWAALKGNCYELDELQYTYKLCAFDKTVQKDKNGYGETSLGLWKEWAGGSGSDRYQKQLYNDGQQCWNGPKRSTEVVIECGEETKLLEATEPAKCEYRFRLETPAACSDPENEPKHEEL